MQSSILNDRFQEEGRREGVLWKPRARRQPGRCLSFLGRIQTLDHDCPGPVWSSLLSQDPSLLWHTRKVAPASFPRHHCEHPASVDCGQLFPNAHGFNTRFQYTRILLSGSSGVLLSRKKIFQKCFFFLIFCCLNNYLLYCWEKPKAVSFCELRALATSPLPTLTPICL